MIRPTKRTIWVLGMGGEVGGADVAAPSYGADAGILADVAAASYAANGSLTDVAAASYAAESAPQGGATTGSLAAQGAAATG